MSILISFPTCFLLPAVFPFRLLFRLSRGTHAFILSLVCIVLFLFFINSGATDLNSRGCLGQCSAILLIVWPTGLLSFLLHFYVDFSPILIVFCYPSFNLPFLLLFILLETRHQIGIGRTLTPSATPPSVNANLFAHSFLRSCIHASIQSFFLFK